jgi:intracellular septation protein
MEQIIDFLPVLAFFIAYKFSDIFVATGVLIGASMLQVLITRAVTGKFKKLQLYLFLILLLMGSLTILFHNPDFLKWKVTVIELILAAAFFISQRMGRPLVGLLFKNLNVPLKIINKVNMQWCLFSVFIALLNLAVAFGLPAYMEDQKAAMDCWVNFKVWGVLLLSIALSAVTVVQLFPYMPTEPGKEGTRNSNNENDGKKEISKQKDGDGDDTSRLL